jgi:hypothetical protein
MDEIIHAVLGGLLRLIALIVVEGLFYQGHAGRLP